MVLKVLVEKYARRQSTVSNIPNTEDISSIIRVDQTGKLCVTKTSDFPGWVHLASTMERQAPGGGRGCFHCWRRLQNSVNNEAGDQKLQPASPKPLGRSQAGFLADECAQPVAYSSSVRRSLGRWIKWYHNIAFSLLSPGHFACCATKINALVLSSLSAAFSSKGWASTREKREKKAADWSQGFFLLRLNRLAR